MDARPRLTLAHAVLLCRDLDGTARFYRETLGLELAAEVPGWLELDAGSTRLTLRRRDRPYDGDAPAGAGVQIAFRVEPEAVDAWYERLLLAAAEVLEGPVTTDYGHRTVFFRDPEGHVVEIYAEV
jgi:catechol 2,3-dioxygenase-like lactoylglutathione lyase family enzyme